MNVEISGTNVMNIGTMVTIPWGRQAWEDSEISIIMQKACEGGFP